MPQDKLLNEMAARDPMLALQKASRITAGPELMRGEMPLGPSLHTLGKPVAELLGTVFKTKAGSGLPSLLRLTNWNAGKGMVGLHSVTKKGQPFEAAPAQLDEMIDKGWLDLAQPAVDVGNKLRRAIASRLK